MPGRSDEVFLPFAAEPWSIPAVIRFKSTLVTGSVSALRERGHFDRYSALLPERSRDAIVWAVAGAWMPTPVVLDHYGACEQLVLPEDELVALGANVTVRVQGTALAWAARVATDAGVSPWTLFAKLDRLWSRVADGGGVAVFKLGPKDARVELAGFPLARYRYNRLATCGILSAMLGFFCSKVFVRELPSYRKENRLGYSVQWA